jgi:hypothetical protein
LSFELWNPPALLIPIQQCVEDSERKIDGKCWDLKAVQDALAKGELKVQLSGGAHATMVEELLWSDEDVIQFILCLNAYFSDRGRPFQADRGRQIRAVGDAPGRRASTGSECISIVHDQPETRCRWARFGAGSGRLISTV